MTAESRLQAEQARVPGRHRSCLGIQTWQRQRRGVAAPHRIKELPQAIAILDCHHSGEGIALIVNLDHRFRHSGGGAAVGALRHSPAHQRE